MPWNNLRSMLFCTKNNYQYESTANKIIDEHRIRKKCRQERQKILLSKSVIDLDFFYSVLLGQEAEL